MKIVTTESLPTLAENKRLSFVNLLRIPKAPNLNRLLFDFCQPNNRGKFDIVFKHIYGILNFCSNLN